MMREVLKHFQVDRENKLIAGVCAGLANALNIETIYVRLVFGLVLLSRLELALAGVLVYAYLAGWMTRGELSLEDKKTRNNAIITYVVLLVVLASGGQVITTIYDFGRATGAWLASLF